MCSYQVRPAIDHLSIDHPSINYPVLNQDSDGLIQLIRSNPIVADIAFVMDRSPDYFNLHRSHPGSSTTVVDVAGFGLSACITRRILEGRVGAEVLPFAYHSDLCRHPHHQHGKSFAAMVDQHYQHYLQGPWSLLVALVNSSNLAAQRFLAHPAALLAMQVVAKMNYMEVVPMCSQSLSKVYHFHTQHSTDEMHEALALINRRYQKHLLYRPYTVADFEPGSARYPGFTSASLVRMKRGGKLLGACILYDPSPLVNIRIIRYDAWTAKLVKIARLLNFFSSALYVPPQPGELMRALHLHAFACIDDTYAEILCRYVNNRAHQERMHAISYLIDARECLPFTNKFQFSYPSMLYAHIKKNADITQQDFANSPLYFNITNS